MPVIFVSDQRFQADLQRAAELVADRFTEQWAFVTELAADEFPIAASELQDVLRILLNMDVIQVGPGLEVRP